MPAIGGYEESEELIYNEQSHVNPHSLYNDDESEDQDADMEDESSEASDLESSPEVIRQRFSHRRANIHD